MGVFWWNDLVVNTPCPSCSFNNKDKNIDTGLIIAIVALAVLFIIVSIALISTCWKLSKAKSGERERLTNQDNAL